MEYKREIITNSEEETIHQGFIFAEILKYGDIVLFSGDLGAGKTEFIKGVCYFFGVEEMVTSPTFTIINQYFGSEDYSGLTIYHIDLYRIKDEKELIEIGFGECLDDEKSIKLIEWAEKAPSYYNQGFFKVHIAIATDDENRRIIIIEKK